MRFRNQKHTLHPTLASLATHSVTVVLVVPGLISMNLCSVCGTAPTGRGCSRDPRTGLGKHCARVNLSPRSDGHRLTRCPGACMPHQRYAATDDHGGSDSHTAKGDQCLRFRCVSFRSRQQAESRPSTYQLLLFTAFSIGGTTTGLSSSLAPFFFRPRFLGIAGGVLAIPGDPYSAPGGGAIGCWCIWCCPIC